MNETTEPKPALTAEERHATSVESLMFNDKTVCGVTFRRPSLATTAYMGIGGYVMLSDPGKITVDTMAFEMAGYVFVHAAPLPEVKAAAAAGRQALRDAALDFSDRFTLEQSMEILDYIKRELSLGASQRVHVVSDTPAPPPEAPGKNAPTQHGKRR